MLLLKAQAYFDHEEFDPTAGYEGISARDQKIRHIQLHVAKAALKVVMADRDIIVSQVIPDTAIYRSQIINLLAKPVRKQVTTDLDHEYPITFPDSETWEIDEHTARSHFGDKIVLASGHLATYVERREHGAPADETQLTLATYALDEGARGLAELYGVDVMSAHARRLEENLGRPLTESLLTS